MAASALQAFFHVDPYAVGPDGEPAATEDQLDLARVGAMRLNELIAHSRGLVNQPMTITFVGGAPKADGFKG